MFVRLIINFKNMIPLKILKTCFSKTAISHYLIAKEAASTIQEYEILFRELAFILFEIDNCLDLNELENNFYNNAHYPFFSDDHKEYLKQQFSLYSDSVMSKIDFRDYDLEKFDNLDKYKFI
jgi:hypothetical protein